MMFKAIVNGKRFEGKDLDGVKEFLDHLKEQVMKGDHDDLKNLRERKRVKMSKVVKENFKMMRRKVSEYSDRMKEMFDEAETINKKTGKLKKDFWRFVEEDMGLDNDDRMSVDDDTYEIVVYDKKGSERSKKCRHCDHDEDED